jgi:hypothetical protein
VPVASTSDTPTGAPPCLECSCHQLSTGVELRHGRIIGVPLERYPRLVAATSLQRREWVLMGSGKGIHWQEIDEDIWVEILVFYTPEEAAVDEGAEPVA